MNKNETEIARTVTNIRKIRKEFEEKKEDDVARKSSSEEVELKRSDE